MTIQEAVLEMQKGNIVYLPWYTAGVYTRAGGKLVWEGNEDFFVPEARDLLTNQWSSEKIKPGGA